MGHREWVDLTGNGGLDLHWWLNQRESYTQADLLFIALDRVNYGKRLSGTSVYRIVQEYGKQAGVSETFSPHKIRHSGVTAYLEMTDGDLRGAQSYSRHANLNTLKHYNENRQQLQKKASEKLSNIIS